MALGFAPWLTHRDLLWVEVVMRSRDDEPGLENVLIIVTVQ